MKTKTVSNPEAAKELFLFAAHEQKIYVNCSVYTIENLRKKYLAGNYDKNRAVVAWEVVAKRAAKMYAYIFGGVYHKLFNAATRRECAELLEDYYYEQVTQ